jgi:hypothetical protein
MAASLDDGTASGETVVNATADRTQTLQSFSIDDLAEFTLEKRYSDNASRDFHLFYVGRDNVHEILKYVLSRVRVSLYLNMFGYDDDELNDILMAKVMDPHVTMLITLHPGQAGGVHEKKLLEADQSTENGLDAFNTHFVIGQSETYQISHAEGFVADGRVGAEGSVDWSVTGEGTIVVKGHPGGFGYKAQNNTQSVFTDPDTIARFQAELIQEYLAAQKGGPVPRSAGRQRPPPPPGRRHLG